MIPSRSLPVAGKKYLPKTRVAAVAYRKNSYHSTTVPTMEAATIFFRPVPLGACPASFARPCSMLMVLLSVHIDTCSSTSDSDEYCCTGPALQWPKRQSTCAQLQI